MTDDTRPGTCPGLSPLPPVRIRRKPTGSDRRYEVTVDGHDISDVVSRVNVDIAAGDITEVTLTVIPGTLDIQSDINGER